MGKRTKLLATVALPIASLVWQPVQAAPVRPALSPVSQVVTVQVEGELSEDELLLLKRQQQRKKQRDGAEGEQGEQRQQDRQKARQERQREAEQEQQGQQERQKAREERRQKQREAEQDQQQGQQDRQKAREERRQKQREAEQDQQQNQQDRQKAREERRQKQREAAEEEQRQEERQNARDEKRRKEREAARQQEEQKKPRARTEAEREQQNIEELRKASDAAKRKKEREAAERRQRLQEAEQQREETTAKKPADADGGNRPARKRDAERERIARDPSKTADTIELPVEDGAPVLDSDKDWNKRRDASREDVRKKRVEERQKVRVRVPQSDEDAQVGRDRVRYQSAESERGERRERRRQFDRRDGWNVERRVDDRLVINFNDRIIVRSDDSRRLSRRASETYYEALPNGREREVIVRPNGDRVVTIRDRYGEIIQRSRIDRSGREYVMFYAPEFDRDSRPTFVDPGMRLPPMRLSVPLDDYIADTSSSAPRDYREFLEKPPVEEVERVYSLDEVRYSARIRDKVRRIDLDTITFATGSADISMNQASTLRKVADAINAILDEDAGETFLIEGHTDAVGSDESNLVLSDRRAESVADVLTDVYGIPPENLATQGYGERFLKIDTDGPEQLNRRVTIRRVTPLVKPVAMAE